MDITSLLPSLPEWASIPIILLIIVVTLWPKILLIIQEFSSNSKEFKLEKQKLELLRLRYEIEAIKKENKLDEILQEELPPSHVEIESDKQIVQHGQLKFWSRFGYGAVGSFAPILLNLMMVGFSTGLTGDLVLYEVIGISIRLILFALLSGIGAAFLSKNHATKQMCFLTGLSISLLFSLLIAANGVQQYETAVSGIS